jgi:hypothetical protein
MTARAITHKTDAEPRSNDDRGVSQEHFHEWEALNDRYDSRRVHIEDLNRIRSQYPFLEITQWPGSIANVKLAANVAQDIRLPNGTVLVRLSATAPFLAARGGNATLDIQAQPDDGVASLVSPTYCWFYARGLQNISVISEFANCVVSAHCILEL